jgi:hypothetical protein
MLTWIIIAVIVLAAGGFVAYRAGRSRTSQPQLPGATAGRPLLERTIRDLRVDDVVQHDGRDWLVEGVITYDEDGHTWRAARAIDGGEVRWLLVGMERGPLLTVRLLTPAADVELTGYPPEAIERQGVTYKLAQRGNATATVQGNLDDVPGSKGMAPGTSTRCRWWRYSAAGEKSLIVEQWGDHYRAMAGETLKPDDLDLLAAS